jgi:hypothetical protein
MSVMGSLMRSVVMPQVHPEVQGRFGGGAPLAIDTHRKPWP